MTILELIAIEENKIKEAQANIDKLHSLCPHKNKEYKPLEAFRHNRDYTCKDCGKFFYIR